MKSLYCFMLDSLCTYKQSSAQKIELSEKVNLIAQNIKMVKQNGYKVDSNNIQFDITNRIKSTEAMNWGIVARDIKNVGESYKGIDDSVVDLHLYISNMVGKSSMIFEFSKNLDSEVMHSDYSQMDDHLRSLIFLQQYTVFS